MFYISHISHIHCTFPTKRKDRVKQTQPAPTGVKMKTMLWQNVLRPSYRNKKMKNYYSKCKNVQNKTKILKTHKLT